MHIYRESKEKIQVASSDCQMCTNKMQWRRSIAFKCEFCVVGNVLAPKLNLTFTFEHRNVRYSSMTQFAVSFLILTRQCKNNTHDRETNGMLCLTWK